MGPAEPYRSTVAAETLDVPTRRGRARLELAPQYTQLNIDGKLSCTITEQFVTLALRKRRKTKRMSLRLADAKLAVALSFPGHEVAIWMESPVGLIKRLCGTEPLPALLDDRAMRAWRQMDVLAGRLCTALASRGSGRLATEYGKGQHRVLMLDHGDRFEVFARPLFREWPRKVFELARDGDAIAGRKNPRRVRASARYDVAVTGDRVRLMGTDGSDVAQLYLPWIAPEDRREIARRFDALLRGHPP